MQEYARYAKCAQHGIAYTLPIIAPYSSLFIYILISCLWMQIQPLCRGLQQRKSRGHRLMMRQQMAKSTRETRQSRDARSTSQRCHIKSSRKGVRHFGTQGSRIHALVNNVYKSNWSVGMQHCTFYYHSLFFFGQVCDSMKL